MKQTTREYVEAQSTVSEMLPEDYQLNLSDFALFLSVMKVKAAYEDVLSIILDEADLKLKEVKAEQVVLNKSGKRAIRLDAWALDEKDRQFDMEMQNESDSDDIRKRSRFYQGLMDTPVLKSGQDTKYKYLPSTVIIFITQDDIFGKDLVKYTFSEQCEEAPGLLLGDGTKKMSVLDERILDLDRIVEEIKQSEEWEAVSMSILDIGLAKGRELGMELGIEQGRAETLIRNVESVMKNFNIDLRQACEGIGTTVEKYESAKELLSLWKKERTVSSK